MKILSQLTALLLLLFTIACGGAAPETDEETMVDEAMEAVDEAMDEVDDDEDGNEREITLDELPQVIKDAIAKQYAGASIDEAEEVTAEDGVITYEVELKTADGEIEVMYAADGQFLGLEEDNDDDDEDDHEDHEGHNHD